MVIPFLIRDYILLLSNQNKHTGVYEVDKDSAFKMIFGDSSSTNNFKSPLSFNSQAETNPEKKLNTTSDNLKISSENNLNSYTNKQTSTITFANGSLNNELKNITSTLAGYIPGFKGPVMDILSSTAKKSEDKPQFIYNVIIQFDGENQNFWDDVNLFTVNKYASAFTTTYFLRVNLTTPVFQQLTNDINDGKYPQCTLYLYTIDTLKNNKLKNLIYKKKLSVRACLSKTEPNLRTGTQVMTDLILMNPVLHNMLRKYTYNKVHTSKSAYEVLKDYESYIDSTYGTGSFVSKHYLCNENQFKYKQLVTKPSEQGIEVPSGMKIKYKTKSDISIPLFLQYKYKIDNGYSMYFFDDFVVTEQKDIVRYFVSFYDSNKLEKFDIRTYKDITDQTQFIKSYPFNDYDKNITKDNAVITHKLPNSQYTTQKTQSGSAVSDKSSQGTKVILSDEKRYFYALQSDEVKKPQQQGTEEITLQSPDSKDSAEKRLKIGVDTILKKIDSIEEYVIFNTSPDWLRFGCVYNLNSGMPEEYIFSPVGIINVFHRIDAKEKELSLMDKALFIKFKPQKLEKDSVNANPIPESNNSSSALTANKEKQLQSEITRSVIQSHSSDSNSNVTENVKKTNKPKELIDEEKNRKAKEELTSWFNDGGGFDIA